MRTNHSIIQVKVEEVHEDLVVVERIKMTMRIGSLSKTWSFS